MTQNKIAQLVLGWGGALLAVIGLAIGMSPRSATLPSSGGTMQCGTAWSPNTYGVANLYPAVGRACDNAIGNSGIVGVIVVLIGVVMLVAVLATASVARPAGMPDHP